MVFYTIEKRNRPPRAQECARSRRTHATLACRVGPHLPGSAGHYGLYLSSLRERNRLKRSEAGLEGRVSLQQSRSRRPLPGVDQGHASGPPLPAGTPPADARRVGVRQARHRPPRHLHERSCEGPIGAPYAQRCPASRTPSPPQPFSPASSPGVRGSSHRFRVRFRELADFSSNQWSGDPKRPPAARNRAAKLTPALAPE